MIKLQPENIYENHFRLSSLHNLRSTYTTINKHKNLHYDNAQDSPMSFKILRKI